MSVNGKSGLGVTHPTWQQAKDALRIHLASFIPAQVVTLTPEMCVRARDNEDFGRIIADAAIVVCDGVGVAWGENRLTGERPEKIPGIDLADWALEEVDRIAGRVFLLGATDETVKVAVEKIENEYPRLKVAGFHDGYFDESEKEGIVKAIAEANPHLVLVGMGSPKQEIFISCHLNDLRCGIAMGIGGSFDVWSGNTRRAPGFFRATGTEWLYRTISQPGARLRRLPVLLRFIGMVLNESGARLRD